MAVVTCIAALSACGTAPHSSGPSAKPTAFSSAQRGLLTNADRAAAIQIAERTQRTVRGTFIGATAFVTRGTPFDPGSACDLGKELLTVRLVWKADANFVHSGPGALPGTIMSRTPPDGPRKALLVTVYRNTSKVCETAAMYRNVGAANDETLLYGRWPGRTDR